MNTLFDICEKENLTYEELKEGIDKFSSEINSKNEDKETTLMLLCKHNPKIELIKLMVQSGANVNISNIDHCLLYLFLSEKDFDIDVVDYTIKLGCDRYKNGDNNTILHMIIKKRVFTTKKLEILMKLKPDMINEVNDFKITPLMYLCKYYSKLELVKLFIKYGADPNLLDSLENNCLVYLFFSENDFDIDVVEYLISQGCDIGFKIGYDKNAILHKIIICDVFTTKKLEILVKFKPDMINEINKYGVTPLMCLCEYYPELELVKLFVEYGAKVDSVDHKNKNCFFYLFNGYENFDLNVAEYLISQGCKFIESIDGLNVLSLFIFDIGFDKINFLAGYNQKLGNNVNVKVREYFNFKNKLSFSSNQLFY